MTQFLMAGPPNRFQSYTVLTNPYIVGATAEVRLTGSFSIGMDALLRHWSYIGGGENSATSAYESRTTANAWEFPIFGRYRFRAGRRASPFLAAGIAVNWLQHTRQVTSISYFFPTPPIPTTSTSEPPEIRERATPGIMAGGGVDIPIGRLHVMPEARYTWWTERYVGSSSGNTFNLWSNRNEVQVLVGLTF